jgi:hypothetical protein
MFLEFLDETQQVCHFFLFFLMNIIPFCNSFAKNGLTKLGYGKKNAPKARLGEGASWHGLRHEFCLASLCVPINIIIRLVNASREVSTKRIYKGEGIRSSYLPVMPRSGPTGKQSICRHPNHGLV